MADIDIDRNQLSFIDVQKALDGVPPILLRSYVAATQPVRVTYFSALYNAASTGTIEVQLKRGVNTISIHRITASFAQVMDLILQVGDELRIVETVAGAASSKADLLLCLVQMSGNTNAVP